METIDLNADLGESFGAWNMGDDKAMLAVVSSANIACGFHAGEPNIMAQTVQWCRQNDVAIGAHPGFQDIRGFGRRRLPIESEQSLRAMLLYQIGALQAIAHTAGAHVAHVKLHGALANMASEDLALAKQCTAAIAQYDSSLRFIAMANTALQTAAEHSQLTTVREIYADRQYNNDGTLVPRSHRQALIHDPNEACERVLRIIDEQAITSLDGIKIPVTPETVCVHGDTERSVKMAESLHLSLEKAGIAVCAVDSSY